MLRNILGCLVFFLVLKSGNLAVLPDENPEADHEKLDQIKEQSTLSNQVIDKKDSKNDIENIKKLQEEQFENERINKTTAEEEDPNKSGDKDGIGISLFDKPEFGQCPGYPLEKSLFQKCPNDFNSPPVEMEEKFCLFAFVQLKILCAKKDFGSQDQTTEIKSEMDKYENEQICQKFSGVRVSLKDQEAVIEKTYLDMYSSSFDALVASPEKCQSYCWDDNSIRPLCKQAFFSAKVLKKALNPDTNEMEEGKGKLSQDAQIEGSGIKGKNASLEEKSNENDQSDPQKVTEDKAADQDVETNPPPKELEQITEGQNDGHQGQEKVEESQIDGPSLENENEIPDENADMSNKEHSKDVDHNVDSQDSMDNSKINVDVGQDAVETGDPGSSGTNKSPQDEKYKKEEDHIKIEQKPKINEELKKFDESVEEQTHLLSYFVFFTIMMIVFYLIFHNKQKILALLLEGRRKNHGRRGRSSSAQYRKLDNNLEEGMGSNGSSVRDIIY